jgi:hypothetical protein
VSYPVHGWNISVACGVRQPVPAGLADVLLPIVPLRITAGTRPGLFGEPVQLSGPACPGDHLVAFLGRQPRLNQVSDLAGRSHIPEQVRSCGRAEGGGSQQREGLGMLTTSSGRSRMVPPQGPDR